MRDSQVSLVDGRTLAYTDIGEPDWPCVFFFHGAPMSRLHLAYLEQPFLAESIRVVSPDRPAYGGSSPQPGRSMADWPSDVAALADALGIDRFVVAGHSSGGPYAVACASLLPERVLAGIVLGGVTDMGWPGAWEGYIESECELMCLPDDAAGVAWCVERYGEDGKGFFTASDLAWTDPDKACSRMRRLAPSSRRPWTRPFGRVLPVTHKTLLSKADPGRSPRRRLQCRSMCCTVYWMRLSLLHTAAIRRKSFLDPPCACSRDTGISRPWQSSRPWRPLWLVR
jgi:pimeloyl-ACP methyl ester carboxylesterase